MYLSRKQKRVFALLLLAGCLYFILMIWPNSTGAKDPAMISIFEPDESAQYAHPLRMLSGGETFKAAARRFVYYQHYYYGFPFYVSSALFALLPAKILIGLGSTQLNMLLLRQMISVLPMILAVLVFVYLQTRYTAYLSSLALFIFLLTVPAVFNNSTWWHPDSLVILFISLTFFFLDRDELRFGKNFYLAAAACGLATATKLLGLFFFLAIPAYILIGYLQKRITLGAALRCSFLFVFVMTLTFVMANPFLLNPVHRARALKIQTNQAEAMSLGWNVLYSKGPVAWYPMIEEMYGHLIFIVLVFALMVISIWKNHKRLLNFLILAFTLPFLIYVLFTIVIKPTHFLLPAALPLYSGLAGIFTLIPLPRFSRDVLATFRQQFPNLLWAVVALPILGYQAYSNLAWDARHYRHSVNKEGESAEMRFFTELNEGYLSQLPEDLPLNVFRDVRAYFPQRGSWTVTVRSRPANYAIIESQNIDLVVLWYQRALDYTQEGVLDSAIDRQEMELAYQFYADVRADRMKGYALLYRTECCSAFLRADLYQQYFP